VRTRTNRSIGIEIVHKESGGPRLYAGAVDALPDFLGKLVTLPIDADPITGLAT